MELPPGSQYALTFNVASSYGGMTASMLQRSRAFVRHAGAEVTILTYDHDTDYEATQLQLRQRGAMVDGMHLRNMWEDMRGWDEATLAAAEPTFEAGIPETFDPIQSSRAHVVNARKWELRDDQGDLLQIDRFRDDGTLLATDLRPTAGPADRRLTLCDTSGRPIGTWTRTFPMLAYWLDKLPREPVAWIIVESKTTANVMIEYDRPDVAKLHVVRGSHLKHGTGTPVERELVESRRPVMENLAVWDSIVLLTETQHADIEARFGKRDNVTVLPNSRNMPAKLKSVHRRRGRGVMLVSLDSRKRVDQAIRAMVKAARKMPRRRPWLDVWGDGLYKDRLQALIAKLQAPVSLRGHSPTASDAFTKASFSLLTSRSEALPGVLLESMGRGCIPISYDLPYGPADIITHGVDGFLVPNSDINALADQICQVVRMPHRDLAAMRRAAHRSAQGYSDELAVGRWSALMHTIAERRGF
jgi:poly(glycerol-phosphate) alpha-glucosyltransferase